MLKKYCKKIPLLLLTLGLVQTGTAEPTNPQIVKGSANINQIQNVTSIKQASDSLVINWQDFNIKADETVNFLQPNSGSIALNRVIGLNGSEILGSLNANGQVFLINPNGILFGKSSQVNVGGLVASTLNITDDNFLKRNFRFEGNEGSIRNLGLLSSDNNGYIALLSPSIINEGNIQSTLGSSALASGERVSLDFAGDGLIQLNVDQSVVNAYVENKGIIKADGGKIIMTAHAKDSLMKTIINNEGIVQAQTLENKNGVIKLLGSMDQGQVKVSGKIDASAPQSGDGGFIETSGHKVSIDSDTKITTKASNGKSGNWFLDPVDYLIAAAGGDTTGTLIATTLASSDVTILASNDITINDAISTAGSSGGTLTFQAGRSIAINENITSANGDIYFYANEETTAGVVDADRAAGSANIIMDTTKTVNAGTGDITFEIKNGSTKTNYAAGDITLGALTGDYIRVNNYRPTGGTHTYGGVITASDSFYQYNWGTLGSTVVDAAINVAGQLTYFGYSGNIDINASITNSNSNGQISFYSGNTHLIDIGAGVNIDASSGDGIFFNTNRIDIDNTATIQGGTRVHFNTYGSTNKTVIIGGVDDDASGGRLGLTLAKLARVDTPVLAMGIWQSSGRTGEVRIDGDLNRSGNVYLVLSGAGRILTSATGSITANGLAISNFDGTTIIGQDNNNGNVSRIAASAPYQSFTYSQTNDFSVGNVSIGGKPTTIFSGINSLFPGRGKVSLESSSGSISIDSVISLSTLNTLTPQGNVDLNSAIVFNVGGGAYRTYVTNGWSSNNTVRIAPETNTVLLSGGFYKGATDSLFEIQQQNQEITSNIKQNLRALKSDKEMIDTQVSNAEKDLLDMKAELNKFDSDVGDQEFFGDDQEILASRIFQTEQDLLILKEQQAEQDLIEIQIQKELLSALAEEELFSIEDPVNENLSKDALTIDTQEQLANIRSEGESIALQSQAKILKIKTEKAEQDKLAVEVEKEILSNKIKMKKLQEDIKQAQKDLKKSEDGDSAFGVREKIKRLDAENKKINEDITSSEKKLAEINQSQSEKIAALNEAENELADLPISQEEREILAINEEKKQLNINDQSIQIPNRVYEIYGLPLSVQNSGLNINI